MFSCQVKMLRPFIRQVWGTNVRTRRSLSVEGGAAVVAAAGAAIPERGVLVHAGASELKQSRRCAHKKTAAKISKMLQTFEERVFQAGNKDLELQSGKEAVRCNATRTAELLDYEEEKKVLANYEEAVKALNSLQSNAESLLMSERQGKRSNSVQDTEKYLLRSGLMLEDLDKLSYIHVSGTKGKGSTCAMTESILRCYGVKTGFFSSPHLVSLTERIRINGQPISKSKFVQYFWPVYDALLHQQEYENDMPAYFKFLTILCFHVFLSEKVEVAILEVGIGGELDCTNVIRNTKTVGITSLGLEHVKLLGDTLQEIAWQKAGIIKPNAMVFTSVRQPGCLQIIEDRCKQKMATMYKVPEFEDYFTNDKEHLQLMDRVNNVTILNGSLALQLAYDWLRQNYNGFARQYGINEAFLTAQAIKGLWNCSWPGRCQVVNFFNLNMHLDGAHTSDSMQVCGKWFAKVSAGTTYPKILMFNTTGDRDSRQLLQILSSHCNFDLVCFVPNISSTSTANSPDTTSVLFTQVDQLKRLQMHSQNWQQLCRDSRMANNSMNFTTVLSCFQHLRDFYGKQQLDILVTGSIHLIGAAIISLNELGREFRDDSS